MPSGVQDYHILIGNDAIGGVGYKDRESRFVSGSLVDSGRVWCLEWFALTGGHRVPCIQSRGLAWMTRYQQGINSES